MATMTTTGYWFDEVAADRAAAFFPLHLKHTKGQHAGKPFHLLGWQETLIRDLFGWKRPDGTRKYRRAYVEIPRKNGKSQIAAGIALLLLFIDKEPGAEIYSAASDRDQAKIVFQAAHDMVSTSPKLDSMSESLKMNISVEATKSFYRVLTSEVGTKHGLNAHGVIFDELHTQKTRDLWDVLTTSIGARTQPLIFAITTAGYDKNSICYEQHEYAMKVLEGTIDDPEFYPLIFAAPDDADWTDPKVWALANPSLGDTILPDYIEAECRRAQETPGYVNTFRRLQLNQWTESYSRWLDIEAWNENGEPIDPAELEGEICWGGLDLSTTTDLSAFVLVFPRNGGFVVLCWFWVPEETILARSRQDRAPYDVWVREGWIEATEGNVIDYDYIEKKILELGNIYNIQETRYDKWNATALVNHLMAEGLEMVDVGQGYASLSAPSKELEKLVISQEFYHGGNPVLRWCAANVVIETDAAGNIKPSKKHSTERIDGIAAAVNALSGAIGGEDGGSVYDERGFLSL